MRSGKKNSRLYYTLLILFRSRFSVVFIRALVVALTILSVWWPLRSFGIGLGLGNANVESTLSSPLRISIPLRGMDGVVLDPEKFSIEIEDASRPNMMHRLEDVVGDNATIILYTRQMVTDPVVQFRLKVKWQRSAIARSYDVFIDPPRYRSNAAREEPAPVAADPASPESQVESPAALAQQERLAVPGPITIAPPATLREGGSRPVPEPASDSAPDAQLQADFELEAADGEAPVSEPATRLPE
jgi:hypothetical protein